MESKARTHRLKHVVSSHICPPAVPTYLVTAFLSDEDIDDKLDPVIAPVLALESRVVDIYTMKTEDPPAANEEEAVSQGYHRRRTTELVAIINDEGELTSVSADDDDWSADNMARRIVTLPTVPAKDDEDDQEFLRSTAEEMRQELLRRYTKGKQTAP